MLDGNTISTALQEYDECCRDYENWKSNMEIDVATNEIKYPQVRALGATLQEYCHEFLVSYFQQQRN